MCNEIRLGEQFLIALLDASVTVVPCVNIDGGVNGNHRTNAAGRDFGTKVTVRFPKAA